MIQCYGYLLPLISKLTCKVPRQLWDFLYGHLQRIVHTPNAGLSVDPERWSDASCYYPLLNEAFRRIPSIAIAPGPAWGVGGNTILLAFPPIFGTAPAVPAWGGTMG